MRELPIIFSAPMIRALLDGRKTMTRRIIKPQPSRLSHPVRPETRNGRDWVFMNRIDFPEYAFAGDDFKTLCAPGDRLWVREKFAYTTDAKTDVGYIANSDASKCDISAAGYRIRPSLHMPRWASRLTLIKKAIEKATA